ncbi:putative membrane protein YPR109W [Kluyveromyces marxianus]|uniref:Membrane protein YPR109W n=1 Tax=Kluyveromyces marxianus TaxID=4911 RepID=A0ABX6EYG6_KLUMA|nr:putative membrane protein YPR109W [Kluyveromyces marxianus]
MTSDEVDVPAKDGETEYRVQTKEFRRNLTVQLQLLGFVLIVVSQLKYAGSIVLFMVRLGVQSVLGAPFPSEERLMRFTAYYRANNSANSSETNSLRHSFKKLEAMLLYVTLVMNFGVMVCGVVWPIDFEKEVDGFRVPGMGRGLSSYGSPFNHMGSRVIEGEVRRHWFTQYIGERVPSSNVRGNASYMWYQWGILVVQVGLGLMFGTEPGTEHGTEHGTGPGLVPGPVPGPEGEGDLEARPLSRPPMVLEMDPERSIREVLGSGPGPEPRPRPVDDMV